MPNDQVRIGSSYDPKKRKLQLVFSHKMQQDQASMTPVNTVVDIDFEKVSKLNKNLFLQTAVDAHIGDNTKLEVKYTKLQKKYGSINKSLEQQEVKLKASEKQVSTL